PLGLVHVGVKPPAPPAVCLGFRLVRRILYESPVLSHSYFELAEEERTCDPHSVARIFLVPVVRRIVVVRRECSEQPLNRLLAPHEECSSRDAHQPHADRVHDFDALDGRGGLGTGWLQGRRDLFLYNQGGILCDWCRLLGNRQAGNQRQTDCESGDRPTHGHASWESSEVPRGDRGPACVRHSLRCQRGIRKTTALRSGNVLVYWKLRGDPDQDTGFSRPTLVNPLGSSCPPGVNRFVARAGPAASLV